MINWFYGRRAVLEILKSDRPVQKILIGKNVEKDFYSEIGTFAKKRNIVLQQVSQEALDSITKERHQGVAVQAGTIQIADFKPFLGTLKDEKKQFVCLLDEIQDPQNLGALLRSALCFGCSGAVIPKRRSVGITGAVMKASSGAAAHLPVAQISNLTVAIERLKEKGFYVYGADAAGENLTKVEMDFPLALILGNEHRGIKPVLKESCDKLIAIPQTKTVASLNVSSAAAVIFYEISRRMNSIK